MATKHVLERDKTHKGAKANPKGVITSKNKGCIIKCGLASHGDYRKNGYNLVKGDGGRNQFLLSGYLGEGKAGFGDSWKETGYKKKKIVVKNPDKAPDSFAFEGQNYLTGNKPFKNNAHHIMPWAALKGGLTNLQGKALQKAGYNLNGGNNIIFLPCLTKTAEYIGCYSHPGRHAPYDDECRSAVQTVVKVIKDGHKIDDSNVKSLKASLETWQGKEYKVLVKVGRKNAGENIKNHLPSRIKAVKKKK
jgi:hypothetical protein